MAGKRPDDYGLGYGSTFTHDEHGELTVITDDVWPVVAIDNNENEFHFFEVEVEEIVDGPKS